MTLREQIQSDMKDAMRAHDAAKLNAIRMLWSSVKQKEVDERITADDSVITAIIAKAVKERHDSIEQYQRAGEGRDHRSCRAAGAERRQKAGYCQGRGAGQQRMAAGGHLGGVHHRRSRGHGAGAAAARPPEKAPQNGKAP